MVARIRMGALLSILLFVAFLRAGEEPQVTFALTDAEGNHGSEVTLSVLITTDTPLPAWGFGVAWDGAKLSLLDHQPGKAVDALNGGEGPDYILTRDDPCNGPGITQGVFVSFLQTDALPVGKDQQVLEMQFSIEAAPLPGEPVIAEVTFSDQLACPPVAISFEVEGENKVPDLTPGEVTVIPPPGNCMIEDLTCESDPQNIYLQWEYSGCGGPRPFDFLYLYREKELLQIWPIGEMQELVSAYDDLDLDPGVYHYTLALVYWPASGDPITLDYIQCEAEVIPVLITEISPDSAFLPGFVQESHGKYKPGELVITGRGFTSPEDTSVTIGDLEVEITEVTSQDQIKGKIPCSNELGVFDIKISNSRGEDTLEQAFTYGWVRGDVDVNGTLDLQDGMLVLKYLFEDTEPPVCLDAVDINDDGLIEINDAVFLFSVVANVDPIFYKPPEPFDAPLVEDPTEDNLDCALEEFECNF